MDEVGGSAFAGSMRGFDEMYVPVLSLINKLILCGYQFVFI